MGMFDNISPDALAALAAGGGMMTPPTRVPVPFLYSVGQGLSQIPGALSQYQQLKSGSLDLQRKEAFQPLILNQIKNMTAGAASGAPFGAPGNGMSMADQQFSQAYNLALASGDMGKASTVLQSWAEHNPQLAGSIKGEQEGASLFKTPEGTYVKGSQMGAGVPGAPGAAAPDAKSLDAITALAGPDALAPVQPPQPGDNAPLPAPQATSGGQGAPNAPQTPLARDGKPFLAGQSNLFQTDPTGAPKYKTANTETGVALTKDMQTADLKANEMFSSTAASLQNEQFRLNELTSLYKQVQAGTITAQNPELMNKLIAWGVVKDPATIKGVADVQAAMQTHVLQIIQQIKDTNANMGGQPTRIFGSEISNLQDKGSETAAAQPEALWNIIGQARGLVDAHLDMVKGWDSIGGLGNRQANGYTLRPDDYARKFIDNHDIGDYKSAAQKEMGAFKGMAASNTSAGAPQITKSYARVGGKLVAVGPDGKPLQ